MEPSMTAEELKAEADRLNNLVQGAVGLASSYRTKARELEQAANLHRDARNLLLEASKMYAQHDWTNTIDHTEKDPA